MVEVYEHKYGFNPRTEGMTSYVRRRFHLITGGNPQLWMIHYLRAPDEGNSQPCENSKLTFRSTPRFAGCPSALPTPSIPIAKYK